MHHDGLGPNALELLSSARRTLLDEIGVKLDGDARYQLLLVAHALAVAGRELAGRQDAEDTTAEDVIAGSIDQLIAERSAGADAEDHGTAPVSRLCAAIRNGRFDHADARRELLDLLRSINRRTLELTNPRFIED